ncbi:hypothetical protein BCF44_11044 [Kutzneria buriramensis]|uniref:Uncharacterized protein n=2 Tax=Kutzneria buriramensis TaxID=1045776 RepID=A0A3E0HCH2_9PSEU|nr:hypothetical protein BCF44_11044 [Kutzneria buriramensis]
MDVVNDSIGLLVLFLEPVGEDRWLRPGERFRIRTDYRGDEPAFSVTYWVNDGDRAAGIENVTVWVENGGVDAEVSDVDGADVDCGHQRPEDIDRKWQANLEKAKSPEKR